MGRTPRDFAAEATANGGTGTLQGKLGEVDLMLNLHGFPLDVMDVAPSDDAVRHG